MNCHHCNTSIEYYAPDYIGWCQSCINNDWDLLVSHGAVLPAGSAKEYPHSAFYWDPSNADNVKRIPPITLRTIPDVPEPVLEVKIIDETVQPTSYCKRIYYGIKCDCINCGEDVTTSIQSETIFCKMNYYGIPCNCGNCPPVKRRRYR